MSLLQHMRSIAAHYRRLIHTMCNPYRPERHYMRGPGPRWRARHSQIN